MGYAVDQSLASLRLFPKGIALSGSTLPVEAHCLWFVLKRATRLAHLGQLGSLILLMKLAEWKRRLALAGLTGRVRISYYEP